MKELKEVGFSYSAEEYKFTELSGVKMIDFYNNIELMVEVQKKVNKIISDALDIPPQGLIFARGHVKCPEYMGCEMYYPDDDEPFVKRNVLNDIHEVKTWRILDPSDNPIGQDHLKKTKQFYEITGIKISIGGFEGPFTTAAFMRGQTEFMMDWVDNPSLCEKLVGIVTDAIIDWKRWHDAEMRIGPEPAATLVDDSIPLISPRDFEEMVLPHLIRWFEAFPYPERHFHCCGDITRHMGALSKLNLTHYDLMGEMVDVVEAKKAFKKAYISQLFDFRLLRDGTEKDILDYTHNVMESSSIGGNFGIVVEGIRGVPLRKARIVRDTVAKFNGGKLPTFNQRSNI